MHKVIVDLMKSENYITIEPYYDEGSEKATGFSVQVYAYKNTLKDCTKIFDFDDEKGIIEFLRKVNEL